LQKTSKLKRLGRHLLTTTCLTVGGVAVAHASPILTGVTPSETFPGTVEAVTPGAVSISGSFSNVGNYYLDFTGLPVGDSLSTLDFVVENTGSRSFTSVIDDVASGAGSPLTGPQTVTGGGSWDPTATVQADGDIVVGMHISSEGVADYTISFTDPGSSTVPEPASLGVVGLGLAGIGVLARRRAKQS
jgi:hypothetical protein